MANSINPLFKHFRQPALYINLTSKGEFWKDGSLDLTVTGDIPVYPMTAKDEITLRTPDALLNGTSVVTVIESCCPSIKNAWDMPSIDVDSTLIAIRIASYGESMPITAKCPHCNEEHEYDINLQDILNKITPPNYNETVLTKDGLEIKFKPLTYEQVSKSGVVAFEEQKLIQSLANPDLSEEVRNTEYKVHVAKMIELNTDNVTNCTASITADGNVITDVKFIKEYYQNAESAVLRLVQAKVKSFADQISIKPEDSKCSECEKEFKLNVEFDYSHFFAKGF